MDDVMTMDEIERRFDAEWVLLDNLQTTDGSTVTAGRVVWHSPNRDEVWDKALEIQSNDIAVFYIGDVPEDVAILI
jgi:hypothetical protein